MGEYLSMGIPVIGNNGVGDVEHTIEKYDCGIVVKDFNVTSYLELANSVAELKNKSSEKMLLAAEEYFDLKRGVETYSKIYRQLD